MLTCVGVRKAKRGDPQGTIELLWRRQAEFARDVNRRWQRVMNPSAQRFRRRVTTGELTARKIDAAFRAMNRDALRFGDSTALETEIRDATRDAYIIGSIFITERDAQVRRRGKLPARPESIRKADPASVIAGFNLSLVDEDAIKELGDTGVLWFRDVNGAPYFDAAAQKAIRDDALELIAQGKDGGQVAKQLADKAEAQFGVGKFADRGRTYWGGVAEHAATTAGIRGQLSQLVSLGWERYEIINPMDERTTDICQYMNGKTVLVSAGVAEVNAVASETTPDGVRAVKPFVSGGSSQAVTDAIGRGAPRAGAGDFSAKQSATLAQSGLAAPPYHFRCRSYIDIAHLPGDPIPELGPELAAGLEKPTGVALPKSKFGEPLTGFTDKGTKAFIAAQYAGVTSEALPTGRFSIDKLARAAEDILENEARTASGTGAATAAQAELRKQLNELGARYRLTSTDLQRTRPYRDKIPVDRHTDVLGDVKFPRTTRTSNIELFDEKQLQRQVGGYYTSETGQISADYFMTDSLLKALRSPVGKRDWYFDSLHVWTHETMHGYGAPRFSGSGLGGLASKLEEVATEMTTRFIMRDVLVEIGADVSMAKKYMSPNFLASYKNYIDGARAAMRDTFKTFGVELTEAEAHEELAKLALNYKRQGLARSAVTDKHVRANFVDALEVPPELADKADEVRKRFSSELLRLWDIDTPGG